MSMRCSISDLRPQGGDGRAPGQDEGSPLLGEAAVALPLRGVEPRAVARAQEVLAALLVCVRRGVARALLLRAIFAGGAFRGRRGAGTAPFGEFLAGGRATREGCRERQGEEERGEAQHGRSLPVPVPWGNGGRRGPERLGFTRLLHS